jgi:hypothetical protein
LWGVESKIVLVLVVVLVLEERLSAQRFLTNESDSDGEQRVSVEPAAMQ